MPCRKRSAWRRIGRSASAGTCLGFRGFRGFEFRGLGCGLVGCLGYRVQGVGSIGFRFIGFRVWSLGFRVCRVLRV